MKKSRCILAVLLCAAMVMALVPAVSVSASSYSGTCGDNLTWELDTDTGILTISGTGEMTNYGNGTSAPWYSYSNKITEVTIDDGVTSIGDKAFQMLLQLTSISISDSVTSIGSDAFYYCRSLTDITIPDGVAVIGDYAFDYCSNLASVSIPDSVTSIGNYVFRGCSSLTSISIPNNATSIGNYAFRDCSSLTSVTISGGVTSIGNYAFYGCSALTSISIPDSVVSIGNYAFAGCSSLKSITMPDSVITIGTYAFYRAAAITAGPIGGGYDYEFGWTTTIPAYAFYTINLTSITLPDSVTTIGDYAFAFTALTSITIPESATSIGKNAFYRVSITTAGPIGGGYDCEFGWTTTIPAYAFYGCSSLTSITMPDSVTSIGNYAFYDCSSLTSVTIPDSTTSIGTSAFYGCSGLTNVTIPMDALINSNAFDSSVTISGYNRTCAEAYAMENGNEFISLGDAVMDEVVVTTVTELLLAIKSNRKIILEDGYYSLSRLRINNVFNLSVEAKNTGKAEILCSNGYYSTVYISNSSYISIEGLILGHSTDVWCSAAVIEVDGSSYINVDKCDLFGCGMFGVYLNDTSGFCMNNSVIRDCSARIAMFLNSDAEFSDCIISGNAYSDSDRIENSIYYSGNSENNTITFSGCVFINNYNESFCDSAYSGYIITNECIFENNAWDGKTPIDCGVCLNGITWSVGNNTLYLGYDLTFDGGELIESTTGEVLPYSDSSLPWKKCSFGNVVTADGVAYDRSDGEDDGGNDENDDVPAPSMKNAYASLTSVWIEDEDGNIVDSGEEELQVNVTLENYTSGMLIAVGYLNGVSVGLAEMDVFEEYDGSICAEGFIDSANADAVKIFCWNSLSGMIPLCDAINAEMY